MGYPPLPRIGLLAIDGLMVHSAVSVFDGLFVYDLIYIRNSKIFVESLI
jgi:hypothetical protein